MTDMDSKSRRDFLLLDLERAWERVSMVDGPELDDRSASLEARSRALTERVDAFFEEMTGAPRPGRAGGRREAPVASIVDGLIADGLCFVTEGP